jgi:hypothetical protein
MRLFQNFSFGTATLDLSGKVGFRPLFLKPVSKLTEFWNWLKYLKYFYQCAILLAREAVPKLKFWNSNL